MRALLAVSRWIDAGHAPDRPVGGVADRRRRAHQRRQRPRPQDLRHQLERLARVAVVAVRRRVPAGRAVDARAQRAHPHRHREQRFPRWLRNAIEIIGHVFFLLPMAALVAYTSWPFFVALVRAERAVVELRRPAAVAGEVSHPARLRAPVRAGAVRADQAHRHHQRRSARRRARRRHIRRPRRALRRISQVPDAAQRQSPPRRHPARRASRGAGRRCSSSSPQNLAPIMFVALVVFLLLGYPVAFSLAAVGLIFFVVGVELAPLLGRRHQPLVAAAATRCPIASSA